MRTVVDLAQVIARDVRVNLRRRDVGVAEQQLHFPQPGAAIEHVGGEGMAQRVRRHPIVQAQLAGIAFDDQPEPLTGEPFAARVQEEGALLNIVAKQRRSAFVQIDPHHVDRFGQERHHTLLVAFPHTTQLAGLQVEIVERDLGHLADAHAGGVEHLQQRHIAQRLRRRAVLQRLRDQAGHFLRGQRVRELLLDLRRVELFRRVVVDHVGAQQEMAERFHRRHLARDRG